MSEAAVTMTRRFREGHAGRLQLLEGHGQIDGAARRAAEEFVGSLAARFGIDPESEGAAMFITHVAVAFTRVRRDESAPAVPHVLVEELSSRTEEKAAVEQIAREMESDIGGPLPDAELFYITAHVCTLRGDDVS
jgi:transcriptional regulatory protein LevR